MEEFLLNFHFLRPWLLLLLVVPLFFYRRYFHGLNSQSSWEKVCDKKLLDFLLIKGSSKQRKMIASLVITGLISATIAVAGPSWKKVEIPSLAEENPLMILLNMSSDMKETDLTPSRLERAKYKIKDFLSLVQGAQVGLEVYSNEPFLIAPLTDDSEILSNLLPAINFNIMPSNGDRLDRAITLAIEKLKGSGYNKGNILIFTPDVGQRFDLAIEQAKVAARDGFKINIINTSTSNNEKLQLIAKDTGGTYSNLQSGDIDIRKIAQEIRKDGSGELKKSDNLQSIWLDYGYYLTILPMLCCLYLFRKGIAVIILFLALSGNAQAGFFINDNQEGLQDFEKEDYQRAAENFKDANWQAAAQYRMGDYAKALQYYNQSFGTTATYNQGNALAKSGKIEDAIKKYEQVLEAEPNHEDAKFNLEYLKKQQEEQKQNQQNQQNNQDNKQEQKQDKQDSQQNQQQNQGQDSEDEREQNPQENQEQGQQSQNGENKENQNEQQEQMSPESQPQEENSEEQKAEKSGTANQENKEEEKQYDEQVQARAQQYREIPEDAGGLLKAFIRKEYNRNRYDEK